MFHREADMTAPVAEWMRATGLLTKAEFITPWGICDLVGLSFNRGRVAHRLRLKQTRAVSSITRAVLLLQIPNVETRKSTTLKSLIQRSLPAVPEDVVAEETTRLITDRFVISSPRGRLQKVNGWVPLQDRLVAVELKLSWVEQAMHQALSNLGFAEESYVGLPTEMAHRVASHASRWSRFFDAGVGLLSVTRRGCKVLIPAHNMQGLADTAIQLYCVEKFWRTRPKGN